MRFFLLSLYLLLALSTDLVSAAVYAAFDWPQIEGMRLVRDGLALALFVIGFVSAPLPAGLRLVAVAYLVLIGLYGIAGIDGRLPVGLVVGSAGKIALPVLLVFAGAGAVQRPGQLRGLLWAVAGFGIVSTLFGAWEISRTEFWTDTLDYGGYLEDIKGLSAGLRADYSLPFNFFGFDDQRRAAGLVAAPLAQGSILAGAAVLAFALLRRRSLVVAGLILALLAFGVYQSGTRGALLILLIALPLQVVLMRGRGIGGALMVLALLLGVALESLLLIIDYTVNLQDGSTIGHVWALERNLQDLGAVILAGDGLGEAGALAADAGLEIAGGGEGALFSVIYQIGGPGGLLFLVFYALCFAGLYRGRRGGGGDPEIAAALCALLAGAASSLILSEHVLTVSGMAPVWLAVGAALRLVRPAQTGAGAGAGALPAGMAGRA